MEQITGRRRTETLVYIQSMLGQLRTMAQAERCDMLAYLIEMAYLETGDIIRGVRPLRSADGTATALPTIDKKAHGPRGQ
jgi:hypothetical protein